MQCGSPNGEFVSIYYDHTSLHGRMLINFILWFQRSILIVFRKILEVLRLSQNYEKFFRYATWPAF